MKPPVTGRVSLRSAAPADIDALVLLEARLFGDDAWSRDSLAGEVGVLDRRVVVASVDGEVRGYAVTMATHDTVDLARIAVDTVDQRRGLGTAMLHDLIEHCRGERRREMLLEVAADNAGALTFYSRHGFREIARRAHYYTDGREAIVMRLDLTATSRA